MINTVKYWHRQTVSRGPS